MLVAAARQDHDALDLLDLVQEMLDQSALAHSRTAVHAEHDGLASPDRGKGIVQGRQVPLASHQDLAAGRLARDRARLGRFLRGPTQLP